MWQRCPTRRQREATGESCEGKAWAALEPQDIGDARAVGYLPRIANSMEPAKRKKYAVINKAE